MGILQLLSRKKYDEPELEVRSEDEGYTDGTSSQILKQETCH